ncbi:MAG: hypothetical protein R2865_11665 [Deinococcales bacterium]
MFVEKPLAQHLEASYRVVETIRQTGVPCQVGFMRRYDPAYLEVKSALIAVKWARWKTLEPSAVTPISPS